MDETFLTKEEKKRKRDEKITGILVVLIFAGGGIYLLLSGIYGLCFAAHRPVAEVFGLVEENNIYEGEAVYYAMGTWCTMSHTVNGIIPTGKEYYYLVFSEDKSSVISVRAGKRWADAFPSGTYNGVLIKGQAKRLDYQERNRLMEIVDSAPYYLADSTVNIEYYVDLLSGRLNIMRIFSGAGLLFVCLYFYLLGEKPKDEWKDTGIFKPVYVKAVGILAVAVFVLTIYLCSMI